MKNQKLVLELAHLKRLRFGSKNKALSVAQRQLFEDDADQDLAAIAAGLNETPVMSAMMRRFPVSKSVPVRVVSHYPHIWNV